VRRVRVADRDHADAVRHSDCGLHRSNDDPATARREWKIQAVGRIRATNLGLGCSQSESLSKKGGPLTVRKN
jgi:hypothetical protein